jgi:hypothetical protein
MQYFHLNFFFLFVDTFPLFSPNAFAKQQVAAYCLSKDSVQIQECINQYEVGYCTLLYCIQESLANSKVLVFSV